MCRNCIILGFKHSRHLNDADFKHTRGIRHSVALISFQFFVHGVSQSISYSGNHVQRHIPTANQFFQLNAPPPSAEINASFR